MDSAKEQNSLSRVQGQTFTDTYKSLATLAAKTVYCCSIIMLKQHIKSVTKEFVKKPNVAGI